MATTASSAGGSKWFDKLPAPLSTPASMDVATLHGLLQQQSEPESGVRVLIVDVRRADIEVRSDSLIGSTFQRTDS